ncbi:MAG: hypothetical protein HY806_01800 [Nitrospirae bacterium]|nr:hypothetical protein [Nitrospirota bacterium]
MGRFYKMMRRNDIHKIHAVLFMQRLFAFLLVLECIRILSTKLKGEDNEHENDGENCSYDSAGNRQTETTATGLTNYLYNANRLVSGIGEKTFNFTYDNNGNTISDNSRQYIYNQNQRLIKAVESGVTTGEYTYNGNGQRVKKTVDGQTTIFHYDRQGMLIAESTNTGTITNEYVYLNDEPLAKIGSTVSVL